MDRDGFRDEFYTSLVNLCQAYGFTTDHTYDLLDQVVDSIVLDSDTVE